MNMQADPEAALGIALAERPPRRLPRWMQVLHVFIIANLAVQAAYGAFQVFWVMQPEGIAGPMFGRALDLPFEFMVTRRMYAIEAWLGFIGLALYLGITEVLPRRLRR